MNVTKKDNTQEPWDTNKIKVAIHKAAERCKCPITDFSIERVILGVLSEIKDRDSVSVSELHSLVIHYLAFENFPEISKAYQEYRDYKNTYVKEFENLKKEADNVLFLGDKENANFDSSLSSTKGSLIRGYLTKALYKQFYLSKEEKELTKRGDIYIHDLRDMILGSVNCCLFDIGTVLKGGFEMSNTTYTEPNSVLSALQVIGDVTLIATAQQFGGFTLAELDKVLLPYCKKTMKTARELYKKYSLDDTQCENFVWETLTRELTQGFQSMELKVNTIPCSRGDFAFTTITFGQFDWEQLSAEDRNILCLIDTIMLDTRMKGHGGKQVVFPKLVYLFDEEQVKNDLDSKQVYTKAIECSSKCMYPDWLSLRGDPEHNVVADTFINHGAITSPMGCRAYLTPWADPDTGKYITIGRCNIGAVSLNLPVIMAVCKRDFGESWRDHFWDVLKDRMESIREFLKKRYDIIRHTRASTNPMAFTQGGFYKGFLKPDDEVGDLVNYMTASFGITALHEATVLWTNGKGLHETKEFANQCLDFINKLIQDYKKEDHYLYALYGTPAESLCATQAKQYRDFTGDTQFGEYFTNSFHLKVTEDVTPFEKQDEEYEFFHKCNGGHIQYVKIANPKNLKALEAVILKGMSQGFYQGVNFDAAYCEDCHSHSTNVLFKCPVCGSNNISVVSRVCGYLGYSNIKGHTRMNDGKMVEIKERKSM